MASTNSRPPPTPEDEIKHFRSIPWCLKHLQPPGSTDLVVTPTHSRTRKPNSEDSLFAETINSPSTISHFVLFYPRGAPGGVKALLTLGSGLDGHPGICHGGVVATIFDEVLGYAAPGCRLGDAGEGETEAEAAGRPAPSYVTAYLNTTYLRPVRTPGTVLLAARTTKVEGRKIWIEASMEDEHGEKLARAEGLFVEVKLNL